MLAALHALSLLIILSILYHDVGIQKTATFIHSIGVEIASARISRAVSVIPYVNFVGFDYDLILGAYTLLWRHNFLLCIPLVRSARCRDLHIFVIAYHRLIELIFFLLGLLRIHERFLLVNPVRASPIAVVCLLSVFFLIIEIVVLVVLRIEVVLCAAVKCSSVSTVRIEAHWIGILDKTTITKAFPNIQLRLQHALLLRQAGVQLLFFAHALQRCMHLLVWRGHAEATCSAPVDSACELSGIRHLLDRVIDRAMESNWIDSETVSMLSASLNPIIELHLAHLSGWHW